MSRRKFTVGTYAKFNRYGITPEHIKRRWGPYLDAGGFIKVIAERSETSWSSTTWYYVFALFDKDGGKVAIHETTAHFFDIDYTQRVARPVRTPIDSLKEQITQQDACVAEAQSRVNEENQKLVELQEKLNYMEENSLEEFNEKEYQAYRVLQVIEEQEDLGRLEKAKLIAKIVE